MPARKTPTKPRGHPHAWDVPSGKATVMIITVPCGFEDSIREWEVAEGDAGREVALRYGMEILDNNPSR